MRRSSTMPKSAPAAPSEALGMGVPNAFVTPPPRGGRTFPSAESKGRRKCFMRRVRRDGNPARCGRAKSAAARAAGDASEGGCGSVRSHRTTRRVECLRGPLYEALDQKSEKCARRSLGSVGDGGPQRVCHSAPARRAHFSERRIQRAAQMLHAPSQLRDGNPGAVWPGEVCRSPCSGDASEGGCGPMQRSAAASNDSARGVFARPFV
jgi:hypothetical protein